MSQQWVRHVARRSALGAQAVRSSERVDRERLDGLAVEVMTALGERTGEHHVSAPGAAHLRSGSCGTAPITAVVLVRWFVGSYI
jgi:hypothetical protein